MAAKDEDLLKCGFCHASVGKEAVVAMNRPWHSEHFLCSECNQPIRQTYQIANNNPFCINCFAMKHNSRCAGCNEVLPEKCLKAMDKHWHPHCFVCSLCRRPLPNGEYYLIDNQPYDLDCHWAKRLEKRNHMQQEMHVRYHEDL
ncbi:hypothetical protein L596_014056 [Steinernema carpocapsae]|uniref:LIM zinc-binding domain-containing protein n=1 Tax=Steinernema carpocapsae TaxID=34508 RepID=A0A4V6A2L5_STECR|nr:hypothetical protein L596_014056 [Steinernema carpocapsae]